MTIKELLNHQQHTGHITLLRQGLFFRAYNESALLINELFGYQIKSKESKSCGQILYYVGFPASVIDKVLSKMISIGGMIEQREDGYIECSGIKLSRDTDKLAELASAGMFHPVKQINVSDSAELLRDSIINRIASFDLSNQTPLQSLQFIALLQQELK